jgi:methylmalonyl-CoA mutase
MSIQEYAIKNKFNFVILIDPIGQLAKDGNWFNSFEKDFENLQTITSNSSVPVIKIDGGL